MKKTVPFRAVFFLFTCYVSCIVIIFFISVKRAGAARHLLEARDFSRVRLHTEKETISGGRFGEATVSFKMIGSLMIGDSMKGVVFFNGGWWVLRTSTVEKIVRA